MEFLPWVFVCLFAFGGEGREFAHSLAPRLSSASKLTPANTPPYLRTAQRLGLSDSRFLQRPGMGIKEQPLHEQILILIVRAVHF